MNNTRLQVVVPFVNATATSITGIDEGSLSVLNQILQAYMPILVHPLIDGNGLVFLSTFSSDELK